MTETILKLAKIVGTSTEEFWSQVHTFFPTEEEKKQKRGRLLAVLALTGLGEGVEAVAAGREVISRLHEEYFGNLEGGVLERLKEAVEKVISEVEPPIRIEIEAAAVLGKILYLAIGGRGRAVVRREGKIGTILAGVGKVETASGYLAEGDIFLLGTAGFFNLVGEGILRAALETGSPQEAVENLAPVIHGREIGGGEAAVIAKVERIEAVEPVETVESGEAEEERPSVEAPSKWEESRLAGIRRILKLDLPATLTKTTLSLEKALAFLQTRFRKRAIYLAQEKPKRQQKTIITIALVLFILLGVSVVLGMRQRSNIARKAKVETLFEQAYYKVDEGKALLDLNPLRARQLLLEAKDLVEEMEKEEVKDQELASFKKDLESVLASVLREHEIGEAPTFLDLKLVKEGASGDKAAVSGGQMIILDKKGASIYGVGISQKSSQILGGGKLFKDASQVAAFGEKAFVLTPEGIVEADRASGEQTLRIKIDEEWGEIVDLVAYGGNLYLLDRTGVIWKYPVVEAGFGTRQRWIKGETKPDFSNSVSMAIDGSIWILRADGTILKFTQGFIDAFGVAGLDKPFSSPSAIYTDDEQENLYILDKGNLRVVVLDKSGEYDSQYIWSGISGVSDIVVSESEKKILLLSGSKIYEIELKS